MTARSRTIQVLGASTVVGIVLAGFLLVVMGSSGHRSPDRGTSSQNDTAREVFGPGFAGAGWDPSVPPLTGAVEVTLAQARSTAQGDFLFILPDTPLASDDRVERAWLGVEPAVDEMLPSKDQTTAAVEYDSDILIAYIPWQYGKDAPAFSQADVRKVNEDISPAESALGIFATDIHGLSALVAPTDAQGQGNPGSVEIELGSTNQDAVRVVVMGRRSEDELIDIAGSIIDQWKSKATN